MPDDSLPGYLYFVLIIIIMVLNALVVAVGLCKKSEISKTFQKLENIWKKYEVFEKSKTKKEN